MKVSRNYLVELFLVLLLFNWNLAFASDNKDRIDNASLVISDEDKKECTDLIDFIYRSPSQFHAVETVIDILTKNGFKELNYQERWKLTQGGKYFVVKNKSTVITFVLNTEGIKNGFNIVAAHTDSPGIHIKPNPEIVESDYLELNTEMYGGPILTSWFDRPLCLSGRVILKSDEVLRPKVRLININEPIAMVANLAIHLTDEKEDKQPRENKQEVMLPILQTVKEKFEKKNFLRRYIAGKLKVDESEILDFDLMFYPYEKGTLWGINNEFIAAARIDDLEAVYAGVKALVSIENSSKINVLACIDNEEIGSKTKQGADSQFFPNVLEKIIYSLNGTREDFFTAISNSFMISADVGHAIHPNYKKKYDPTNKVVINKGILVSVSKSMKNVTDAESIGVIKAIAEKANVPLQMATEHSDVKSGRTFGPIINAHLEFRGVDLGLALLGMHSTNETCGVIDHLYMIKLLKEFYNTK